MGSSYFGEPNMGGGGGGGSSSSSRKGKKSNSDKPKQPQRGLGVAQLEKIRLHGQMGSTYHPSLHSPYSTSFSNEETRAQTAYSSIPSSSLSSSPSSTSSLSYGFHGFHPNIMMGGLGEYERANMTYGGEHNSQLSTTARWDVPGNAILDTQHFVQSSMTRHLLNPPPVEDSHHRTSKKHRSSSMGSSSHNSESSDTQDLDLELRL
ncbi:unnamed protein product [Malus baccata var. baccata]|uniref:Uncharacterized protein n=1 Tax=Malus domestica TaxID=3750 RepID=A0A498HSR3_MALDO|nr:protein SPEAR1-like isoform X1 [Malus domestica]XP_050125018.1 protein SPEAR1-like [Malus sylvestris]RXH74598.1 hypothetical protein DVH24_029319 [Malus domestica]